MGKRKKDSKGTPQNREAKRSKNLEEQGLTFAQMAKNNLVRVVVASVYPEVYLILLELSLPGGEVAMFRLKESLDMVIRGIE